MADEIYTIELREGVAYVRVHGDFTMAAAREALDELARRGIYHRRVWDFTRILFVWSMDDIREIAEYGKRVFEEDNLLAVVAPQDAAFGTLRAFSVYREEEEHARNRAFRTLSEAEAWIRETPL